MNTVSWCVVLLTLVPFAVMADYIKCLRRDAASTDALITFLVGESTRNSEMIENLYGYVSELEGDYDYADEFIDDDDCIYELDDFSGTAFEPTELFSTGDCVDCTCNGVGGCFYDNSRG